MKFLYIKSMIFKLSPVLTIFLAYVGSAQASCPIFRGQYVCIDGSKMHNLWFGSELNSNIFLYTILDSQVGPDPLSLEISGETLRSEDGTAYCRHGNDLWMESGSVVYRKADPQGSLILRNGIAASSSPPSYASLTSQQICIKMELSEARSSQSFPSHEGAAAAASSSSAAPALASFSSAAAATPHKRSFESAGGAAAAASSSSGAAAADSESQENRSKRRKTSQPDEVQCDLCEEKFSSRYRLNAHKRIHAGKKIHSCHLCDRIFSFKKGLEEHIRAHTGEKPFQCSFCDKAFVQPTSLQSHERIHTGEKRFQCGYCPSDFSEGHQFTHHHEKAHPGESILLRCKKCDKTFTNTKELVLHARSHEAYPCGICPKILISQVYLKKHYAALHPGALLPGVPGPAGAALNVVSSAAASSAAASASASAASAQPSARDESNSEDEAASPDEANSGHEANSGDEADAEDEPNSEECPVSALPLLPLSSYWGHPGLRIIYNKKDNVVISLKIRDKGKTLHETLISGLDGNQHGRIKIESHGSGPVTQAELILEDPNGSITRIPLKVMSVSDTICKFKVK